MKWISFKYSTLEFAQNSIDVFLRLYLLIYYTERIGLDSYLVGLAVGISILLDVLISPILGTLVDLYRIKRGEVYSVLKWGALFYCCSYILLFTPPNFSNQYFDFFYLLVCLLFLSISASLLSVPYGSSIWDITNESKARVSLISWKVAIGSLGTFLGIGIPGLFLVIDSSMAYFYTKLFFVFIVLISVTINYETIKKCSLTKVSATERLSLLSGVSFEKIYKKVSKTSLILFMTAYFLILIAMALSAALFIPYYREFIQYSEDQVQLVLASMLLAGVIFAPLCVFIINKNDKLRISKIVLLSVATINLLIYLFTSFESLFIVLPFSILTGVFFVFLNISFETILNEMILKTKEVEKYEVSGLYYSLWKMTQKIVKSLIIIFVIFIFEKAQLNRISDKGNLAFVLGPVISFLFLVAALILLLLPKKYENRY